MVGVPGRTGVVASAAVSAAVGDAVGVDGTGTVLHSGADGNLEQEPGFSEAEAATPTTGCILRLDGST